MKKNLIIEKSFKYKPKKVGVDIPNNYKYDEEAGYWIDTKNGKPMMLDKNAPLLATKKMDVETGEDNKGE